MTPDVLRELLDRVRAGDLKVDSAVEELRGLPYRDIGVATIDHHRTLRTGTPEVIYAESKTVEQIVEIARELGRHGENVLCTRLSADKAAALAQAIPEARYDATSRTALVRHKGTVIRGRGILLVVSAGTSDLPVAEEAAMTAEFLGNRVERLYDVGVAGIHRLLGQKDVLDRAAVIVVVAGMEGALPSVVRGLVRRPVIAVPTSVGYGTSFGGLAALLAMLNSCASGVTVVNIDNGFGAAVAASLINAPDGPD